MIKFQVLDAQGNELRWGYAPDAATARLQAKDGETVLLDATTIIPELAQPDDPEAMLARAKEVAMREIDAEADRLRAEVGSPHPTQQPVYLLKAAQAQQVVDGETDPAAVPLIAASVGIEGETLAEVAAVVLAARAQWLEIAAAIETVRLGGKRAVAAATDFDELQFARASVVWPTAQTGV